MKPKCLIVILLLLTAAGSARLTPDKEGSMLCSIPARWRRDSCADQYRRHAHLRDFKTEISGSAADFIFLKMPDNMPLMPKDRGGDKDLLRSDA